MANLKKLVFRCYTYHRSEYLLRFCSYLARYPHEDLEYVNNWDSTTSLYHKTSGKLLVTFRNENMVSCYNQNLLFFYNIIIKLQQFFFIHRIMTRKMRVREKNYSHVMELLPVIQVSQNHSSSSSIPL